MSEKNGFWDKSGGTAYICALDELESWVDPTNQPSTGGESGPIVAGLFLDAQEEYQGEYRGPLLSAQFKRPSEATHLVFVMATASEARAVIASLMNALRR